MIWIWLDKEEKNTFAEFALPFVYETGDITLRISADYQYAAFIGEHMVSCGQYADLPTYKSVNTADLAKFVKTGENTLRVVAWHMGDDFSVCRSMPASVAFEIVSGGNIIAHSDKHTKCRKAVGYRGGDRITYQLGMGFDYDFTADAEPWQSATEIKTYFAEVDRPIKQTAVGELCIPKIAAQGAFRYNGGNTSAEKMQNAWLSSKRFGQMTGKYRLAYDTLKEPIAFTSTDGDGVFVIADMGRETCGYLGFSVTVDSDCTMLLGWGEHLNDQRVRTSVGGRNFGMKVHLKKGENTFDDYLLRFGCRYLCIFAESDHVTVTRLGIREVGYPFRFVRKTFGDRLLDAIYETGRRTLYLSAHEHYEDCPWREQALYGMDSRNQMLFGYGAFEEYDYPRANMLLIARCLQENGLIPLTAPAEMTFTIPSFTAYWLIAIGENAEADYNQDFVKEILPYAERAVDTLLGQEREYGLTLFTGNAAWNFHEWSAGLDGTPFPQEIKEERGDAGLTALTAIALGKLAALWETLGNTEKASAWTSASARLTAKLESFYDQDTGLYASYLTNGNKEGYHEYTQSLVLCAGGVPEERIPFLCDALRAPNAYGLVPATFSALQLKYQALIRYGNDLEYCTEHVVSLYGKMLLEGATSYYETEKGEADFDDAGSLCHGWSAVGCWVFDQIYSKEKKVK